MNIVKTALPDVFVIEPQVFGDARGFFFESFNQKVWREKTGLETTFVQDNQSHSEKSVLRGLHYQIRQPQGKLVRVIEGKIFDVAVDLRRTSSFFGKWVGMELSCENRRQMWIPEGFAHGFAVLSDAADVLYKTTDYWAPQFERTILWNDPDLAIAWPLPDQPILSEKDGRGTPFKEAEYF